MPSGLLRFERVAWSGNNSFIAREEGAAELRFHLKQSHRQYPDAKHLVVAHSHGGTVAVMALDNAPNPLLSEGLLTMGTPFVKLMPPAGGGRWAKFMTYAGCTLPATAYCVSVLVSVSALLRQVPSGGVAVILGTLSLVSILVGRAWLAIAVAYLGMIIGGPILRSDLIGFGLIAVFSGMALPALLQQWKALWPDIGPEDRPAELRCRLLAIRTTNDEASLTIGLAQLVERGFRMASAPVLQLMAAVFRKWARSEAAIERRSVLLSRLYIIATILAFGSLLTLGYDWVTGMTRSPLEFLIVAAALPAFAIVIAVVIASLVWMIPGMVLSFAVGPEAVRCPYVGLNAEPLPHAHPEEAMSLVIDVAASQKLPVGSLHHALHELPHIRRRVGRWIRAHWESMQALR